MSPPLTPRTQDYSSTPDHIKRKMIADAERQGKPMAPSGKRPYGVPATVWNRRQRGKDFQDQQALNPNTNLNVDPGRQDLLHQRRAEFQNRAAQRTAQDARNAEYKESNPKPDVQAYRDESAFTPEQNKARYNRATQKWLEDRAEYYNTSVKEGGAGPLEYPMMDINRPEQSPAEYTVSLYTEANQPGHEPVRMNEAPEQFFDQDAAYSLASIRPELEKTPEGKATLRAMETDIKAFSKDFSIMLAQVDDAEITEEQFVKLAQDLPSYNLRISVDAAAMVRRNLPKSIQETRKKQKAIDEKAAADKKVNTDANIRTVTRLKDGVFGDSTDFYHRATTKAEVLDKLERGEQLDSDTIDEITFNGGVILDEVTGKPIPITHAGEKRLQKEETDAEAAAEEAAEAKVRMKEKITFDAKNPGFSLNYDTLAEEWRVTDKDKPEYSMSYKDYLEKQKEPEPTTAEKTAETTAKTKAQKAHDDAVKKVSDVEFATSRGTKSATEKNLRMNAAGETQWFTDKEIREIDKGEGEGKGTDWWEVTPDNVFDMLKRPVVENHFEKVVEGNSAEETAYARAILDLRFSRYVDEKGNTGTQANLGPVKEAFKAMVQSELDSWADSAEAYDAEAKQEQAKLKRAIEDNKAATLKDDFAESTIGIIFATHIGKLEKNLKRVQTAADYARKELAKHRRLLASVDGKSINGKPIPKMTNEEWFASIRKNREEQFAEAVKAGKAE